MGSIAFQAVDLSSMAAVQAAASYIVEHNFGTVVFSADITSFHELQRSAEGVEMSVAVSFLSRYLLLQKIAAVGGLAKQINRMPRIFIVGKSGEKGDPQLDDLNWESV